MQKNNKKEGEMKTKRKKERKKKRERHTNEKERKRCQPVVRQRRRQHGGRGRRRRRGARLSIQGINRIHMLDSQRDSFSLQLRSIFARVLRELFRSRATEGLNHTHDQVRGTLYGHISVLLTEQKKKNTSTSRPSIINTNTMLSIVAFM